MPFYDFQPLPLPAGYDDSRPFQINDHQVVVGRCSGYGYGARAILWQPGGPSLMNLPGQSSGGFSLNLEGNVVGSLDGRPFFWKKSTGVTTILKGIDGQDSYPGQAFGINNSNQITGYLTTPGGMPDLPTLWTTDTAIPINLLAGVPFKWPISRGHGNDINDNGFVVGFVANNMGPGLEGFSWNANNFRFFLDPKFTGKPSCIAFAANDLPTQQIVGWTHRINNGVATGFAPFMYNSQTGVLQDLGTPGQPEQYGIAQDINNNGDIVGSAGAGAVLWIFNGLIRINLNHPLISNAQAKGWHLWSGKSINNNGYIVGWGELNSDRTRQLPWILRPKIPVRKIPIEHMLPQALWPGQAHDSPKPKGWPFKIPFPIPSPNPFQIVGSAFSYLNNILISKSVDEITSQMSDSKTRKGIQKITSRLIAEEMRKLKVILANASRPVKKSRIASKGRK